MQLWSHDFMKKLTSLFSLCLALMVTSCAIGQDQQRVTVQTSAFARQILTNSTAAGWAMQILLGTNYYFGNFALMNGTNIFTGVNTFTSSQNVFQGDGSRLNIPQAVQSGGDTATNLILYTISQTNAPLTVRLNTGLSVGNLAEFGTGNPTTGTLQAFISEVGDISIVGAGQFKGNGGGLTNLNYSPLFTTFNTWGNSNYFVAPITATNAANKLGGNGLYITSLQPSNVAAGNFSAALGLTNAGNVLAGNGSAITSVNGGNIVGTISLANIVSSGTLQGTSLSSLSYLSSVVIQGNNLFYTPTTAAGTGAGSGSSISLDAAANNIAQTISLTTGSSPSASAIVFTNGFGYPYASPPHVVLTPMNLNAAVLYGSSNVYVGVVTTNGYSVSVATSALTAATAYKWVVHIID